ncbi:hypothetical protein T11_6386 [Trichinella zimbabwensis]|uniref:Uncharacterized protein n=1 Tax=Trichinella zimbabwensis TaxID=268475 RepID=A0A0V1GID4_9BILA|nr:hypothetical protein T11_12307 [Trichinella zimbabwensis]KRY99279.1 hypothetical protein T11_6386 [Trichinella zimbabwensis]
MVGGGVGWVRELRGRLVAKKRQRAEYEEKKERILYRNHTGKLDE